MARLPRLTIAHYPHHLIQRGNNRELIFRDSADYEYMVGLLQQHAQKLDIALHAYVLMGNHFHLLATPHSDTALSAMMQAIGRSYVRYFNRRYQRTGTLWEGRYRCTVVQPERYLLTCMVYIDLNPVRAALVVRALDYPWSSHAHSVGVRNDPLITPHTLFWALGNTPFAREAAYAALVQAGIGEHEQRHISQSAHAGWALGEGAFIAALQQHTARRVAKGRPGRPALTPTPAPAIPTHTPVRTPIQRA